MNRRRFLAILAGAAPVAAVAPTYFFAPVGGWKSDVIVRPPEDVDEDEDGSLGYNFYDLRSGCALLYAVKTPLRQLKPEVLKHLALGYGKRQRLISRA
jgi:hypothetical protein